jgi:ribosomal protein S18 acetylase RimI-like enzyme
VSVLDDLGALDGTELYLRGIRTNLATWTVYAAGAPGAAIHHGEGFAAGVFPEGPEREVFNNAVLDPALSDASVASALDRVEAVYAEAEVARFAVWVTEDDEPARRALADRGYSVDTTTAAMAIELDGPVPSRPFDAGPTDWGAYLAAFLPEGLLAGIDSSGFEVVSALLDERLVSVALGFEHDGDLGVFNVETLEHARRRGLATTLTAYLVNTGVERGCTTATLQATPMAERVYEACGFRTVARIVEYVPG